MARSPQRGEKPDVQSLLARLAEAEQAFLEREFFAPALSGGTVQVRIGGVVCRLAVEPRDFRGYGVFRPASHTEARLVRPATLAERRQYLALFPQLRLILCRQSRGTWYGSTASFGDHRLALEGLAPIWFVEEARPLETVCVRFDGGSFWFDEVDPRQDPATPPFLRAALAERTPPEQLARKGLTAEQRAAYELLHWELTGPAATDDDAPESPPNAPHRRRSRRDPPVEVDPVRRRLHENLSHAGARLVDYVERGDVFSVTYLVGNERYTSAVDKRDLSVRVAGICLSGEDLKFDLASLVGVLREGADHGVVRVGDDDAYGLDEEQYWRAHPQRP
jgi:hypothetical protein